MGKVKLFPTAEYTSKQPRDPIVPRVPCTGIFLGAEQIREDGGADLSHPGSVHDGRR